MCSSYRAFEQAQAVSSMGWISFQCCGGAQISMIGEFSFSGSLEPRLNQSQHTVFP